MFASLLGIDLSSVFKEKKWAFDLIPEWSKEAAYSYVNNKNKVAPKAFVTDTALLNFLILSDRCNNSVFLQITVLSAPS